MELRILLRDQNLDVMDEFLKDGEFRCIPAVIFYGPNQEYIGHWLERPEAAHREQEEIAAALKRERPEATDEELRGERRQRTQARQQAWQEATVVEIKQLLAEKLGL